MAWQNPSVKQCSQPAGMKGASLQRQFPLQQRLNGRILQRLHVWDWLGICRRQDT
jgi:hypothetical protein